MKSKFEIFLDTDIFLQHLYNRYSDDSLLLKCLKLFDCYTSVVNASEIFSGCHNMKMKESAKRSFDKIGVLGIPFRYSLSIGEVLKKVKKKV